MLIMESRRKIRVLYRQCGSIKGVSRRGCVYPDRTEDREV